MSGGIPYLGSKISLISKSEIRYEGILYTIDTKESTVALAKVKSFGTEERPTNRPVAPRDDVYEYIIFRASDIKDLHVSEPPKSHVALSSGLANDPAIVHHSGPIAPFSVAFGQPSMCGLPFQHFPAHISTFFPASHTAGSTRPGNLPAPKRCLTMDAGVQVSGNMPNEGVRDLKTDSNEQSQLRNRQLENEEYQRRNVFSGRQQQNQRGNRGWGRGRGRNFGSNRNINVLKFEEDFDFEQAHAEFLELENKLSKAKIDEEVSESTEVISPSSLQTFYDKQKSFFDNISCEASQTNLRFDWRQERKRNVETFGVPRSINWMRRRQGRGGIRGRGGFRSRPMSRAGGSTQPKTVKFEDEVEKTVVIVEEEPEVLKESSEIPTIELVVEKVDEKDKEWEETKGDDKSEWK